MRSPTPNARPGTKGTDAASNGDGEFRGLRWVLFLGFVACFVLMTVIAWMASDDPFWPSMSLALVALLVVLTLFAGWRTRGAADERPDCLIAFFNGVPRWVGLTVGLVAVVSIGWGAFSYFVRDTDFGIVSPTYVVGWGALALAQTLPRLRRGTFR